ncbi:MAG: transketolase [Patescibacteria group bacterium]
MKHITEEKVQELEKKACLIRETTLRSLVASGERGTGGHTAGPLGMADIFTVLYFHTLNHDPKNPGWEERDRLILSHGHITPVRYVAMAHAGYFPVEECMTLRQFGSRLQGHPERHFLPGVETTSGPLGSGLSQASGIAYAAKMDKKKFFTFCLMSDGEQQEGNTWEAVMFAAKYRLNNLIAIMDRNNIQITGNTEDVMPLEPLSDKYRAFNWHVLEIDGHNIEEIADAVEEAKSIKEKPTLILAHTTPGKGVREIENDYRWHGNPPKKEQLESFVAQLHEACGTKH